MLPVPVQCSFLFSQLGPGPEKWLRNYCLLKEFKHKNGHVKVPVRYAENNLGSWLKTQVTQYRNAQEGKMPALSAERIRLMEEIGLNWGEKQVTTPWDDRFHTLLEYKARFQNVNVPWQWKENVSLAQWVNSQRKKYKDLLEGKRNNLSEEQIKRLNSIGFKWNTGGKGRYTDSSSSSLNAASHIHLGANVLPCVAMTEPVPGAGIGLNQPPDFAETNQVQHCVPGVIAQEEYNNYAISLDVNHNRPVIGGMSQEAVTYAQRLAQQNQEDLSMLAYAYQHMNQQMNAPANFDQNGGNPF